MRSNMPKECWLLGAFSNIVVTHRCRCGQFRFFIFPLFESVRNARPDLDHPDCRCYVIASFVVFLWLSSPFIRSFVHLSIFINSCRLHSSVTLDQTECVLNCILLNGTQHVVDPWCGNLLVWLFLNVHVNEQRAAFKLRLTQLFFVQFQYEPMSRVCRFGMSLCKSIYLACVTTMIIFILWMSLNAHTHTLAST